MTREAALRHLMSEYEQQRLENQQALERRTREAVRRDPRIGELLALRESLFASQLRRAFAAPEESMEISAGLAEQLSGIHAQLRERLEALGLPQDDLQPTYACALCRDTGYVGEPLRQMCTCLEGKLLRLVYQEEGLADLERENFATFDENVFPDVAEAGQKYTQRAYMRQMRLVCERYADGYPKVAQRNLLLTGPSGLGKSFLMNCIAQRVLARGQSVMRISAYELLRRIRAVHFGEPEAQHTTPLFSVSLLLIDDLGTEPMLENVTINGLFTLLNERQHKGWGTVISTNFALEELRAAYTERITSRLLDRSQTQVLGFWGKDVRTWRGNVNPGT